MRRNSKTMEWRFESCMWRRKIDWCLHYRDTLDDPLCIILEVVIHERRILSAIKMIHRYFSHRTSLKRSVFSRSYCELTAMISVSIHASSIRFDPVFCEDRRVLIAFGDGHCFSCAHTIGTLRDPPLHHRKTGFTPITLLWISCQCSSCCVLIVDCLYFFGENFATNVQLNFVLHFQKMWVKPFVSCFEGHSAFFLLLSHRCCQRLETFPLLWEYFLRRISSSRWASFSWMWS